MRAKLTVDQAQVIRLRYAAGTTQRVLAAMYGVSQPAISYIVNQRTYNPQRKKV